MSSIHYASQVFLFLQKTDAESTEEEEEKEETLKPSPDADTVIFFTKPGNQGILNVVFEMLSRGEFVFMHSA